MEENLITWNVANWITVLIMVALGYALIAAATQTFRSMVAGPDQATA